MSAQNKTTHTSSEDFVSSGRCGVFWYLSLSHHTLPNTGTQLRSKNKAKCKMREGALWNPGQKFLKEIKLLKMNRILPTQVFACLGLRLLFVCLVFLAQLFT